LNLLINGYEPTIYGVPPGQEEWKQEIRVKPKVSLLKPEDFLALSQVPNVNQMLIPMKNIVQKAENKSTTKLLRKNRKALVELLADNNPNNLGDSPLKFTERLIQDKLPVPGALTFSWEGVIKQNKELIHLELPLALLAAFFIYTTLAILYHSITMPLVIFLPLPMAIAASFFALYLTGHSINTYSIIGILIIAGLGAKNAIVLLDYTNQLIQKGRDPEEAIFIGSKTRLRAILMSSLAVFLTTLPVLIAWDEYAEIQASLAVAILGGLLTSTIFSLFVVPIFFKYTYRFHGWINRYLTRTFNQPPEM
jgi:HAE1 family hydrophobic/amphiphilic exporter-1